MGIFNWFKSPTKTEEEILRGTMRRIFADALNMSADDIDSSKIDELINQFDNETKQGWLKLIADVGEKQAAVELESVIRKEFMGKASEMELKTTLCLLLLRQSNFTLKQLDGNDILTTKRNTGGREHILMVLGNRQVAENMKNPVIDKFLLTMPDSDKHRPFIILIRDGVIDVFDCDQSQTIFDSV